MEKYIFKNEFCIVLDKDDGHIIKSELLTGQVETIHIVKRYKELKDIPLSEVFDFPENDTIEENKLYNIYGKITLGEKLK